MRSVTCAIFLSLLMLAPVAPALSAEGSPVLAEDVCDGPFVLVVPAAMVREHGGLSVVANDDGAGTRLRFDLTPGAVAVNLERAGATTELGRTDVALPGGDGEIVLKRRADGVSVAYDAATVLRTQAELPDGGRWGVLGPAAALEEIIFQPTGEIVFADDFMRLPDQPATWETISGDWRVAQLPSAKYSANAFTLVASAAGEQPGLAATGYWFWEDLTIEAAVQPVAGTRGFGVGLAATGTGDCHLLRFLPGAGGAGRLQIVRVRGGEESVLAEAPALATPDEWHRLALSGVAGHLTGALDGVELVSADDPALAQGQACLWVAGATPVAFDDVEVYSGARRVDRPVVLSNESPDATAQEFINDEYMQEWADERDQWASGAGGVWHGGYFWGDVELTWELNERSLRRPAELHLCVPAGEDTYHPPAEITGGCHLALEATEDGQLALRLAEGEEARGELTMAMPALPAQVTLRRTGDLVEALVGGQVVGSFTATTPAAGKVGLTTPAARLYVSALSITAHNLIDATFRAAPSDWRIGAGEWGVASRWACTPRWSWFQGRAREVASIWTRRQFPGDVAVEFFAGTAMDQPWAPFYQHPGNLCVTLGGSDATPGSGYTLIFAGWGNSAAGIFRRGELVAQVPGFVMPDILDSLGGTSGREDAHKLHNEWWRIRAERLGSTVRLLVDGRLAASFEDPDPLPGGSVGIFTLDNAMTVARARIYYEDAQDVAPPIREAAAVTGAPALELPPVGPAHVAASFEDGVGAWGPSEAGSCAVALAERAGRGGGRCLAVTNPSAGGSFALAVPWSGVDLRRQPVLAFECAIPEGVFVDAFARVGGQWYRLALTGPEQPAPGIEELGRATEVRADGRWRAVSVDLLGRLRTFFAPDAEIVLEGLEFSARAATGYLRAGIGGNAAGASWRLDNVFLGAPTAGAVDVRAPRGAQVDADGCAVQTLAARGGATHRVTARRSGLGAVTVSMGDRAATDLVAFDLDAPTVEPLTPTTGATWLGSTLSLRVTDAGPAGVAEESLAVEVGGRRFTWPDPALRWDPATGELAVDLRAAGPALAAGKPVPVRVAPAADRAGNRGAPLSYAFTPDPAADATAPEAPRLVGLPPPLLDCDFEVDAGTIMPWGVDADVELRRVRGPAADNPTGGAWCLEARCTQLGGLFGVALTDRPFDARRYPVLSFDYRVPAELRVDLIVEVAGSRRVIKFTDNDATWRPIGSVGAVADGRWHTATVDLQGLLERGQGAERGIRVGRGERGQRGERNQGGGQSAVGGEGPLPVTALAFASSGWPGNRRDTRWWIDNVRLEAALPVPLRAGVAPALRARDESGAPSFAWVVDDAADTEPPAEATGAELGAALAGQAGALAWVHAVAIDAAGNRSAAAHLPVRVAATDDLAPPVASAPTPRPDEAACPSAITVSVTDEGAGVSPADLRLTVNDAAYTIADPSLSFDATSGLLTWTLPAGVALGEDGARVACRLEATDLAGNAMAPLAWSWRIDRGLDSEPPPAPEASYLPAAVADANDFEQNTGGWGNFVEGQVLRRATGGASGPGCLELRHLGGGRGNGLVLVRDFGDDWRQFPMVRFRYRLEGTRSAQIAITGTTFNGARDTWTELGTVPASGEGWRTATLDVARALARTSPSIDIHRIFLSIAPGSPDAAIIVDDYAMYSQAATSAAFAWAAPADPSGIRGYAWVLDNADDTAPPETITGTQTRVEFRDLAPGHWCFHLRACDGAGNWGPATHVPFDLIAPQEGVAGP